MRRGVAGDEAQHLGGDAEDSHVSAAQPLLQLRRRFYALAQLHALQILAVGAVVADILEDILLDAPEADAMTVAG